MRIILSLSKRKSFAFNALAFLLERGGWNDVPKNTILTRENGGSIWTHYESTAKWYVCLGFYRFSNTFSRPIFAMTKGGLGRRQNATKRYSLVKAMTWRVTWRIWPPGPQACWSARGSLESVRVLMWTDAKVTLVFGVCLWRNAVACT